MGKLETMFDDIPEIITPPVNMNEVNEAINIHEGGFQLKFDEKEINLNGIIQFHWFPSLGVNFLGIVQDVAYQEILILTQTLEKCDLVIDGLSCGQALITGTHITNSITLEGTMRFEAVRGDKTIPVTKVKFAIPNLKDFYGLPVKEVTQEGGVKFGKNRLKFENEDYIIVINQRSGYKDLKESLKSKGGYITLYSGELTQKKGSIKYEEIREVFLCFSNFLNFLNGRRCSPLFLQGVFDDEVIWCDYSSYFVDQYKPVSSWTPQHSIEGLNELWQAFSKMWKSEGDKDFLLSAIHWYTEAISNSGFAEGAIIMAQTDLELLYNWLLIEKKKLLIGKDAENMSAANKIRLLLSQLNLNYDIPHAFTKLQLLPDVVDAPDAFVQIRNAIVHSQEEKRKKLKNLHYGVKYEALKLGIWYIELSLLFILQYQGKYYNRCSGSLFAGSGEMLVPWAMH